jgi:2-polyprenyl-6-methoxyphenol hydroxylase-like FAD-dependent oxidoreductase
MSEALITDPEVLVVGGGYIGLSAAVELGVQGVRTLLVEQDLEAPTWHPRAIQLEPRTMEHFRRWGIEEAIRAASPLPAGFEGHVGFGTSLTGTLIATVPLWVSTGGPAGNLSSADGFWLPQFLTERTLEAKARSMPCVEVRRGWRLETLTQDDTGVQAVIASADDGSKRTVGASFVIGADGAGSTVRKQAGLQYEGPGEIAYWLYVPFIAPSLVDADLISHSVMYMTFAAGGISVARPLGGENWDLQIVHVPPDAELTHADLTEMVALAIGRDDIAFEVGSPSPVRLHDLIAARWRAGRVFIAGNAAHLITHAGGHNGNTGVSDVANLGWKLAAVLRGWGGEGLLDSYESERRPIALQVRAAALASAQETADEMYRLAQGGVSDGDEPEQVASRDRIAQAVRLHAERTWDANGISLDQRYTESPIVVGNGTVAPPWNQRVVSPVVAPGHRAPHVPEGDGGSIHDHFGNGFVMLRLDDAGDDGSALIAAASDRGVPLSVLDRPAERYREAYDRSLTLVRPDGHIAWSGDVTSADAPQVIDAVAGRAIESRGQVSVRA